MKLQLVVAVLVAVGMGQSAFAGDNIYNSTTGYTYARNHAYTAYGSKDGQNPFPDYASLGGNCTHFASQVFLAGLSGATTPKAVYANRLNYTVDADLSKNPKWFFKKDGGPAASTRGSAWAGATQLREYANNSISKSSDKNYSKGLIFSQRTSGKKSALNLAAVQLGDFVSADFGHSMIVTKKDTITCDFWCRIFGGKETYKVYVAFQNADCTECKVQKEYDLNNVGSQRPDAIYSIYKLSKYTN